MLGPLLGIILGTWAFQRWFYTEGRGMCLLHLSLRKTSRGTVIGSREAWGNTLKTQSWSQEVVKMGEVDAGRERLSSAKCNICYCGFQIEDMEISLPNIHYFNIDMSKMGLINKEEVREFLKHWKHISAPSPFSFLVNLGQYHCLKPAAAAGLEEYL